MVLSMLILLFGIYMVWSLTGRQSPTTGIDLQLQATISIGNRHGERNIVAVQPAMFPADYASESRYFRKMAGYMQAAADHGMIGQRTVVVFPEYVGAWLVVLNEKTSVYQARTLQQAMTTVVCSNLLPVSQCFSMVHAPDRLRTALFTMKSQQMVTVYQRTFSRLSRQYRTTIVAGSIVLPAPYVRDGILQCRHGLLQNVSVLYHSNGTADAALVRKVNITKEEQSFLQAGARETLPVFNTPAGRIGVLICADAWFPENYQQLRQKRVETIVVPSFCTGNGNMDRPWQGYSGFPAPLDVNPADVHTLTLGQAWERYALVGRLASARVQTGVLTCLRGQLWDIGADGSTVALVSNKQLTTPDVNAASLINVQF